MNDLNGSDPLTDQLSGQFTTVKALHIGFLQGFMENPMATLLVMGTLIFALAFLTRYAIFAVVRLTGRTKLERTVNSVEGMCVWVALGAGIVVGELFFQNIWLAGLTGGAFIVICTGVVLEALVANDHASQRKRALPTIRTNYVPTAADTSAPPTAAAARAAAAGNSTGAPESAPAPRQ